MSGPVGLVRSLLLLTVIDVTRDLSERNGNSSMEIAATKTSSTVNTATSTIRHGKAVVLVLLVCGLLTAGYFFSDAVIAAQAGLMQWMSQRPLLGPVCFVVLYVFSVPLLIPSMPLMLAAGMLFGFGPGVALAFIGNTVGGLTAFLLARSNLRAFVKRRIRDNDTFVAFDEAIRDDGFRTALLLRMSPVLPGWLINYGLGLTALRMKHYLLASIGTIPVLLVYVAIGSTLNAIGELFTAGAADAQWGTLRIGAMVFFVASAGVAAHLIKRRAFRSLEHRRAKQSEEYAF